jgi:hypothetical protein
LRFAAQTQAALESMRLEQQKSATEARRATQIKDFLVAMLDDIDPLRLAGSKGKEYTAAELLIAASVRIDQAEIEDPAARADLMNELASGLLSLGKTAPAMDLADRAVAIFRALPPSLDLAKVLNTRASVLRARSEPELARQAALEALDVLAGLQDADATRRRDRELSLRSLLGAVAMVTNDIPTARREAEAILRARIAILGRDDDSSLAVEWHNIARTDLQLAKYAAAETGFRHAIRLLLAGNPGTPRLAWQYEGLARALLGQDRLEEADVAALEALRLAEQRLESAHPFFGNIRHVLGNLAAARGDYATAEIEHTAAANLHAAQPLLRHVDEVSLANALLHVGRDRDAARSYDVADATASTLNLSADNPWMHLRHVGRSILSARRGNPQALADAERAVDALGRTWGGKEQLVYRHALALKALATDR